LEQTEAEMKAVPRSRASDRWRELSWLLGRVKEWSHCGVRAKSSALGQPGIAAVLSLIWVGLGQIYNGEVLKGILFMVFSGVLFLTVFFYIGFFLLPAFWVYNIYDAYSTAVKSSSTPQPTAEECLPDDTPERLLHVLAKGHPWMVKLERSTVTRCFGWYMSRVGWRSFTHAVGRR